MLPMLCCCPLMFGSNVAIIYFLLEEASEILTGPKRLGAPSILASFARMDGITAV
jgi:hypothetical protein